MATWSRPRSIATIDFAPRDLRTNFAAASRTASLEPLTCAFLTLTLPKWNLLLFVRSEGLREI